MGLFTCLYTHCSILVQANTISCSLFKNKYDHYTLSSNVSPWLCGQKEALNTTSKPFAHSLPLQPHAHLSPLHVSCADSRMHFSSALREDVLCHPDFTNAIATAYMISHCDILLPASGTPTHPMGLNSNIIPSRKPFPHPQFGLGVCPPNLHAPFIPSYSNWHPAWKLLVFLSVFNTSPRDFR